MRNIDELTCWDVYKMIMDSKPLSDKRYQANIAFENQFDDMYFNTAVEQTALEDYEIPFVYKHNIGISKCCFTGTGRWGDSMAFLGGEDYYKSGKRIPGTTHYTAGIDGDVVDENIVAYMSFDDALQSALDCLRGMRSWQDLVTESIYQNNYNPDKYLSVFTFITDYGEDYYVMQYIETYNPRLGTVNRNNVGNRLGEDQHYRYSKADLDALLADYTLVE